jgi:PAS domain-containing protein
MEGIMSSAESRPAPDHKIQLSHTAGLVQPAGSKAKQGPNTTIASQTDSLLATERRARGTNSDCVEQERNEPALQESEERFRLIVDTIPGLVSTMSDLLKHGELGYETPNIENNAQTRIEPFDREE